MIQVNLRSGPILAVLVHSPLLSYMIAMPAARFLFTTCPKIEPELMLDTIMTYLEGYPLLKEMVKMMTKFKSIRKKPENTKTSLLQDMP